MSAITLEIRLDDFDEYPLRLPENELRIRGASVSATIDVSAFARERGGDLEHYLDRLEAAAAQSKFRLQYQLVIQNISPDVLAVDLSRLHFVEVNFENTDLSGSHLGGQLALTRCVIDASLPPLTVQPGELFRYPPVTAARELGITNPKDLFVLRWGLTQDTRHLGQAFLWLERRYPQTERVLARLLKGLPMRPARRMHWSP